MSAVAGTGGKGGISDSWLIHARKNGIGPRNALGVLNLRVNMPTEKLRTLNAIAEALQNVSNVVAVVLGGSCARGLRDLTPTSTLASLFPAFQIIQNKLAGMLANLASM